MIEVAQLFTLLALLSSVLSLHENSVILSDFDSYTFETFELKLSLPRDSNGGWMDYFQQRLDIKNKPATLCIPITVLYFTTIPESDFQLLGCRHTCDSAGFTDDTTLILQIQPKHPAQLSCAHKYAEHLRKDVHFNLSVSVVAERKKMKLLYLSQMVPERFAGKQFDPRYPPFDFDAASDLLNLFITNWPEGFVLPGLYLDYLYDLMINVKMSYYVSEAPEDIPALERAISSIFQIETLTKITISTNIGVVEWFDDSFCQPEWRKEVEDPTAIEVFVLQIRVPGTNSGTKFLWKQFLDDTFGLQSYPPSLEPMFQQLVVQIAPDNGSAVVAMQHISQLEEINDDSKVFLYVKTPSHSETNCPRVYAEYVQTHLHLRSRVKLQVTVENVARNLKVFGLKYRIPGFSRSIIWNPTILTGDFITVYNVRMSFRESKWFPFKSGFGVNVVLINDGFIRLNVFYADHNKRIYIYDPKDLHIGDQIIPISIHYFTMFDILEPPHTICPGKYKRQTTASTAQPESTTVSKCVLRESEFEAAKLHKSSTMIDSLYPVYNVTFCGRRHGKTKKKTHCSTYTYQINH